MTENTLDRCKFMIDELNKQYQDVLEMNKSNTEFQNENALLQIVKERPYKILLKTPMAYKVRKIRKSTNISFNYIFIS